MGGGGGETATMDHIGRGEGDPDLPDVLSGKGGTAEMPRVEVPGESGDKDGNAGALVHRNVLNNMMILKEGNFPHPRCAWCDMHETN